MPHIHDQYDFTVTFFIVHDGKVLLVNHPRYQKWLPPGGHIELNEDPEEALFREIREETGLAVQILSSKPGIRSSGTKFLLTPNYLDVHEANPPHRHIGLAYFARSDSDQAVLSDEHREIRWFSQSELADPDYALSPAIQFYGREAIAAAMAA